MARYIRVRIDDDSKDEHKAIFEEGLKTGIEDGKKEMRQIALDFLDEKYFAEDAPDRGTPEAQAILTLARELSAHLKVKANRR